MNDKRNRVPHCSECKYMKKYDIMYTYFYCDHEDRDNDMGSLSADHPPKISPKWCPKRMLNNTCCS